MGPRRRVPLIAGDQKPWGIGMASARAAKGLPCSWMACPARCAARRAAACEIGLRFGPEGAWPGWLSAPGKNAPAPPPPGWLDPSDLCTRHGEHAVIAAQGGPSRQVVWSGRHRSQPAGNSSLAFQCCGPLEGGRTPWVARQSQASVELPGPEKIVSGEACPEARDGARAPIAGRAQACRGCEAAQASGHCLPRKARSGGSPQPALDGQFRGMEIRPLRIELMGVGRTG